ncbi:unnamed protein product [Cylicocyclus nassatus]|uniref:Uncharacterized protein n=1 Tax=Cylicocyclus nassatus TaxID=53992 RepID=A0AA36GNK8_CYLNA|nr:unnamed protein product [Cylicocyclus nassatus]
MQRFCWDLVIKQTKAPYRRVVWRDEFQLVEGRRLCLTGDLHHNLSKKLRSSSVDVESPPGDDELDANESIEGEVDIKGTELMGHESEIITFAEAIDVVLEEEVPDGDEDDQPSLLEKSAERKSSRGRLREHNPGSALIPRGWTGLNHDSDGP